MRTTVLFGWMMGALALGACDEKPSGGATPAESTSATAATMPASSASAAKKEEPKKPEGPKDVVARTKALEDAFNTRDAKKLAALYTDDAVIKRPGMPDVKGHDEIEKWIETNLSMSKDAKLMHGRIWEKDKHAYVVEAVMAGTNTDPAPMIGLTKATNKPFGVVGATWFEVNDEGLIKEEQHYVDTMTFAGQLTPDKKHPVRAVVAAPPDGTEKYEAKTAKDEAEAKDPAAKAEVAKVLELQKKDMDAEEKFLAAMNGHKYDDAYKLVGNDLFFADYTRPTDIKGLKAFKDVMASYMTAMPDLQAKMVRSFADGDFVVAEWEYTGTQKGAMGPIKPTNKPVDLHQIEVDQFKDGKLVKGWSWGNNAELFSELGVMPESEEAPHAKHGK